MEKDIIDRPRYVEPILAHADQPLVKILTGIRRCGKSTVLQLVRERLQAAHPEAQFISINLETPEGLAIRTPEALLSTLTRPNPKKRTYYFLDEIQNVPGWQEVINAVRTSWDCDIYLTGSNSRMLSGDLATHLAGRYLTFHIHPLAFGEFTRLHEGSAQELFPRFLELGGFPALKYFELDRAESLRYIRSVYDSALINDVIEYRQIRDIDIFHRIVHYALAHVGQPFSANSIARYLKNEQRRASVDTVLNYLQYCVDAFLLERVPRLDVAGKALLKSEEKFYVADHGIRGALGLSNQKDIQLVLENVVYLELASRGYEVTVGRVGTQEVSFIARNADGIEYYQVKYLLAEESTVQREFGALTRISDNHPKYVLSLDPLDLSRDGIVHKNLMQWLLEVE